MSSTAIIPNTEINFGISFPAYKIKYNVKAGKQEKVRDR